MSRAGKVDGTIDDFFTYCPDMVFVATERGAFLRSSHALTRAVSAEGLAAAPQADLSSLVHPDDRAAFDAKWKLLRGASEPLTIDVRMKTADGSFKHFRCTVRWVPEREEVYGSLHDGEERLEQELKLNMLQAINDNLPVCLWAIDQKGNFVLQDGKACEAAGLKPGQFLGLNMFEIYPPEGTHEVRRALDGTMSYLMNQVDDRHWEAWYLPVKNDHGHVTHVAGVSLDITEAKRTELELRSKLELIQKQQQLIRTLSTPIIQVWDRVLTLPLVGMFDSTRAADVMDSVLGEVARTRARYAILDLTGIEAMDTATAGHLLKLSQALNLLGAEGIITGIHPTIAQTIIGLGLDLNSIVTRRTLREGLQHCIQKMSREAQSQRSASAQR